MSSLRLQDAVLLANQHPEISFGQVQQFIRLASRLKDDIRLAQPSFVPAVNPPDVLPPTISTFLRDSCSISVACVEACWNTLKMTIWHEEQSLDSLLNDFAANGHSLGLCMYIVFHSTHFLPHYYAVTYQMLVLCILPNIRAPTQTVPVSEPGSC
jgi:hypothetical protein